MGRWARRALLAGPVLLVVGVAYVGVTFVQVWLASRNDGAHRADAIVVLGAAQYNGRPSPVLQARLDHTLDLWRRDLADTIFVTGGKRPGDRFTEATASANYLIDRGVPDSAILRDVSGEDSWQSLAVATLYLKRMDKTDVILVSDPFHALRIGNMARELGLDASVSPTRTSPLSGGAALGHMVKEAAYVAAGRIVGFRNLVGADHRLNSRSQPATPPPPSAYGLSDRDALRVE